MTWDERLHPRNLDNGQFVEKAGGWLGGLSDLMSDDAFDSHYRPGQDMRERLDYDQLVAHVHEGGPSDQALGDIWRQTGYDGAPRVVDRAEMNSAVAGGWVELFRGVGRTDEEGDLYADQFRYGEPWPGLGGAGNGTYAMPAWRKQAAGGYGAGVMRMALRPDARIAELDDIVAEMRQQGYTDFGVGRSESARRQVLSDVGRYGSAAGYDAVAIRQLQPDMTRSGKVIEWVILNRTALLVQDENLQRSEWLHG